MDRTRWKLSPVKTLVKTFLITLVFVQAAIGQEHGSEDISAQAKITVQKVSDNLIADLKKNKAELKNKDLVKSLVEAHILPATDLEGVSRSIVGDYWAKLRPEQQERLKLGFSRLIVNSFATMLSTYEDQTIEIERISPSPDNPTVVFVNTLIKGDDQPVAVGYYLRRTDKGLGIYDVVIREFRFSRTYKGPLAHFVKAEDFEGLIEALSKQAE